MGMVKFFKETVKGVYLLVIVSVLEENGSVVWQLQLYLLINVDTDLPNSWT